MLGYLANLSSGVKASFGEIDTVSFGLSLPTSLCIHSSHWIKMFVLAGSSGFGRKTFVDTCP